MALRPVSGTGAEAQTRAVAADLAVRHNGVLQHVYTSAIQGFSLRMRSADAMALAMDSRVAVIEPNRPLRAGAAPSWGLDRVNQRSLPLDGRRVHGPSASGVTAYVIDSGVRVTHRDFGGRARHGYDAVDRDPVADDCSGHGTHVAGTLAGRRYGVARDAAVVAVRVLDCEGRGTTADVVAGIDWVTRNARLPAVANVSILGSPGDILDTAVANSIAEGITYVVAAGNSDEDACGSSPARVGAALTVGATTASDTRAPFSNWGRCVDLFAPGALITSAWNTGDGASSTLSGTSMAAPHVAGAAALLLAIHPSATPAQVAQMLIGQATGGALSDVGAGSPNLLLYAEDEPRT
ncbi:S8 family peptidase [Thermoactinospora rubra]|uniref:S8 family peptidase n=1 Tax=Thermoactinospora rubra TaxID=1088767 RepID=UPI00197CBA48|nr:S8 family peptidase [Thermoactinospora rubra]